MLNGAIIGDIAGSTWEFSGKKIPKHFKLFRRGSRFTDDTVMTIAVADALQTGGLYSDLDQIKENVIDRMKVYGRTYPEAGYGGTFYNWIMSDSREPYGSYANGAAMRVSSVGWLYDDLYRVLDVAAATAEVTHNHPEAIKGAQAVAAVIFFGRSGKSKEEIKSLITEMFDYDLNISLADLKEAGSNTVKCRETVIEALVCFFEAECFEDAIRNAISIGGDTDTRAAIAGSMAESMYEIPDKIIRDVSKIFKL